MNYGLTTPKVKRPFPLVSQTKSEEARPYRRLNLQVNFELLRERFDASPTLFLLARFPAMFILAGWPHRGGSRIFLGGGALVSCSTSTPINHIYIFFAEYQLYQKTAGHFRGGAHPLHPPPRSAPATYVLWFYIMNSSIVQPIGLACLQYFFPSRSARLTVLIIIVWQIKLIIINA